MKELLPLPPAFVRPWAEGDCPHGETVDLDEYPSVLNGLRKCRSFRADVRHKMEIIVRAAGGWRGGGVNGAAKALQISRISVRRWFLWISAPSGRLDLERLDNAYAAALEKLALGACRKPAGGVSSGT